MHRDLDPMLLLRRATYGYTSASAAEMRRLGPVRWLERQLKPHRIPDPGVAVLNDFWPQLERSVAQAVAAKDGSEYLMPLLADHVGRAVFSRRQLLEVMVDFWANHLNVIASDAQGGTYVTRHAFHRDVVRRNALGRFESMLQASAFHPTMLSYLNGAGSTGAEPNENYSRELLELHTVGIDAGYTERDVQKGARLLTGWTIDRELRAVYVPRNHHVGRLRVFGFVTANGSAAEGRAAQRAYLKYLAHHPRTARHLATKLALRFVSDDPPTSLIEKLAATYRKHDTAVVPVLRTLFSSREFAESGGEKVRRPMETIIATARVLGLGPSDDEIGLMDTVQLMKQAGHGPLLWALPNGYDDVAASWQSPAGALVVFNATSMWARGGGPRLANPGPGGFLKKPPLTRDKVIRAVAKKLLGRRESTAERKALETLLDAARLFGKPLPRSFADGSAQQGETVYLSTMLLLSSPAHQLR